MTYREQVSQPALPIKLIGGQPQKATELVYRMKYVFISSLQGRTLHRAIHLHLTDRFLWPDTLQCIKSSKHSTNLSKNWETLPALTAVISSHYPLEGLLSHLCEQQQKWWWQMVNFLTFTLYTCSDTMSMTPRLIFLVIQAQDEIFFTYITHFSLPWI